MKARIGFFRPGGHGMMFPRTRRNLLSGATLSGVALVVAACVAPPEPPQPPEPPPPLPVLGSIAAQATVEHVSAATRQAALRTSSGAVLDISAGRDAIGIERLRPGQRLLVEYDAQGGVRLRAGRASDPPRSGRIRGTIQDILPGGRAVTISDQQGITVTFEVPHPAMMAFVTRLRRGQEVAVTVLEPR
jgi:hypothetical protein